MPPPGDPPDPADVQALRHAIEDCLATFAERRGIADPAAYLPLIVAALAEQLAWVACDTALVRAFGAAALERAFRRIEVGEGMTGKERAALWPFESRRVALVATLRAALREAFPEAHGAGP